MPTNEGLRLNDNEVLQDGGKPAVKLDQEQTIEVRDMDPATHLAPQHHDLVTKRRILGLKSTLRLEWRDQNSEDEAQQREHCTLMLSDFIS